jgi:hypothetical protein
MPERVDLLPRARGELCGTSLAEAWSGRGSGVTGVASSPCRRPSQVFAILSHGAGCLFWAPVRGKIVEFVRPCTLRVHRQTPSNKDPFSYMAGEE